MLTPVFPDEMDAALGERILGALAQRLAERVFERMAEIAPNIHTSDTFFC